MPDGNIRCIRFLEVHSIFWTALNCIVPLFRRVGTCFLSIIWKRHSRTTKILFTTEICLDQELFRFWKCIRVFNKMCSSALTGSNFRSFWISNFPFNGLSTPTIYLDQYSRHQIERNDCVYKLWHRMKLRCYCLFPRLAAPVGWVLATSLQSGRRCSDPIWKGIVTPYDIASSISRNSKPVMLL